METYPAMMNSAEAAEEGPNDPDTEPFFKTGSLLYAFVTFDVIEFILLSRCIHPHTHSEVCSTEVKQH